jgi:hypothetical protein
MSGLEPIGPSARPPRAHGPQRRGFHLDLPPGLCDAAASPDGDAGVDPAAFAQAVSDYVQKAHRHYAPISFWGDLPVYLQMTVEKIDLKNLFNPVCKEFHIPLLNISGWGDINSRAGILRRFAKCHRRGKRCVLLHCGDHDPGGFRFPSQQSRRRFRRDG